MVEDDREQVHSGGIQSLDAALRLLGAMAEMSGPVSLTELARRTRMPPSKAHRYLASFQNAGLVVQAGRSGKYDLGPGAVTLGLSAIARHDFVNRASDALPDLRDEAGLTALLSVWGSQGATVIRWERAASPLVTSMGLGTTLPLLNSATGRAFLAWGPPAPIEAFRQAEMRLARRVPAIAADLSSNGHGLATLVETVRAQGYASVEGRFIPGLVAIAAPILDWQGEAQAVVTLIGTDPLLVQPDSDAVTRLIGFCQGLSFSPIKASNERKP
ncbi:MAG: IclR family transcriptional regulator [Rhizobiaceae bacterium]|nr:IclR family transcriptional regulator [Rhizobiaceae bacterium]MCV0407124.1 IclR family transcriptional regulator [Rhizobiaceae bacterium]